MTRKAHGAVCRCGAAILVGDDADRAALTARVDPVVLSRTGELFAVCDRRHVYARDPSGALHRRDRWMLRSAAREPVHAEHRCGDPPPATWLLPPTPPRPRPATPEEF
jgi:hypothetical protein